MPIKQLFWISLLCSTLVLLSNCKGDDEGPAVCMPEDNPNDPPFGTTPLESSTQRMGDADAGYDYQVTGDYVESGVPIAIYLQAFGNDNSNFLNRTGDNATISHQFTAIDAPNGVRVVAANCLQCHSQVLDGELIVGLGNSLADFTFDQSEGIPLLDFAISSFYGANSPEYDAYVPFRQGVLASGPEIVTAVKGANPADKFAAVLAAHRNNDDLTWSETPIAAIPSEVIPTDVPAWWLLKKKSTMFQTGVGRGDFARISMASSLLTLTDSTRAREIDGHFADVIAFINTIEPPAYPENIDAEMVQRGATIFKQTCQSCHGTYGVDETYPNLLVDLDVINTDPTLTIANFAYDYFVNWYNDGWFNQNPYRAELIPGDGYIAPPLDGVWATAPYLHNGSVPTLEDLLNSSQRPEYWSRDFGSPEYDYEKVGWKYDAVDDPGTSNEVYNTTLLGYGNGGHTFGDGLAPADRADLIEYLKTL